MRDTLSAPVFTLPELVADTQNIIAKVRDSRLGHALINDDKLNPEKMESSQSFQDFCEARDKDELIRDTYPFLQRENGFKESSGYVPQIDPTNYGNPLFYLTAIDPKNGTLPSAMLNLSATELEIAYPGTESDRLKPQWDQDGAELAFARKFLELSQANVSRKPLLARLCGTLSLRDTVVAASVFQWLGTNGGLSSLKSIFDKAELKTSSHLGTTPAPGTPPIVTLDALNIGYLSFLARTKETPLGHAVVTDDKKHPLFHLSPPDRDCGMFPLSLINDTADTLAIAYPGLYAPRLDKSAHELAFAKKFMVLNADRGSGAPMLASLCGAISVRDRAVAATLFQWLGSHEGILALRSICQENKVIAEYLKL